MTTNTCTQDGKTYVISDIHGRYDKYMEMFKKINFGHDDTLCFLGDAMDRGPDGIRIMLDIMSRPNVHSILGNNEAMALDALPVLETVRDICNGMAQDGTRVTADEVYNVNLWFANGRKPTVRAYMKLPKTERTRIFRYMKSLPLYREIEVEGRKFILVHAALGNFSPERPLEDYSQHDLVRDRLTKRTKYFDDKTGICRSYAERQVQSSGEILSRKRLYRHRLRVRIRVYTWRRWRRFMYKNTVPEGTAKRTLKMNNEDETQDFALHITNGLLYDELHRYAQNYSLPVERLTEIAGKRFVEDVELFKGLRAGHLSSK